MSPQSSQRDLRAILRSRVPLVVIETRDEARARAMIVDLARESAAPAFEWAVTRGLRRVDTDLGSAQAFNADPAKVLAWISEGVPGIYILLDLHPYLVEPLNVRMLKDICQGYDACPRTVVLISHQIEVPAELEHLAVRFPMAFPNRAERRMIVEQVAGEWASERGAGVQADQDSVALLVENLSGLSVTDTRRLARTAVYDDGVISRTDAPAVMKAKYDLLNRGGVLTFEYDTAPMADLAGMARLKAWLMRRRPAFDGSGPGLDPPKGVLLLGVQGCGKSLAARVAAGAFGVPLLRLDVAAVHDKYVGESERRLRESLATADVMAPCVVWIDEIEKGFATSDGDSGSSQRVLGTFLTWLAERTGAVFVVATANDVTTLPPELIRKGRFDEVFFVDLPDAEARSEVLAIHARRREVLLNAAQVESLAAACEGFSGAEIEQVVVSAAYAAHADGGPVNAEHLLQEIHATRPLSVVMAERIVALRAWASGRTVPAN